MPVIVKPRSCVEVLPSAVGYFLLRGGPFQQVAQGNIRANAQSAFPRLQIAFPKTEFNRLLNGCVSCVLGCVLIPDSLSRGSETKGLPSPVCSFVV
eukprot:403812-Amphidinium_carterae.1